MKQVMLAIYNWDDKLEGTLSGSIEVKQETSFGHYMQEVLSKLVWEQIWDDPYAALTPGHDPSGERLNILFRNYLLGIPVERTAKEIQLV